MWPSGVTTQISWFVRSKKATAVCFELSWNDNANGCNGVVVCFAVQKNGSFSSLQYRLQIIGTARATSTPPHLPQEIERFVPGRRVSDHVALFDSQGGLTLQLRADTPH